MKLTWLSPMHFDPDRRALLSQNKSLDSWPVLTPLFERLLIIQMSRHTSRP